MQTFNEHKVDEKQSSRNTSTSLTRGCVLGQCEVQQGFGVQFRAPAVPRSVVNICSACIKFVAFGVMVGSGAKDFMVYLIDARCYNEAGMQMVQTAGVQLLTYIMFQARGALHSRITIRGRLYQIWPD